MYSLLDTLEYDNQLWQVERRYYCSSMTSVKEWMLHTLSDNTMPIYNRCLVNCDTAILEHVIMTDADSDGIISLEREVDKIIGYDTYFPITLICCHPNQAKANYPFWPIAGNWSDKTYVTYKSGILYVCSQVV